MQTTTPVISRPGGGTVRHWTIEWVHPCRRRVVVGASPITFGRGERGDGLLEGAQISRHHARLLREGPILVVEDLASRNGTHVEGARIERAPVGDGTLLRLGEWLGVVRSWPDDLSSWLFGELSPGIVGGARLAAQLEIGRRIAPSDVPVVVEGETGTGKERVAQAVHAWSRRGGAFVALNCAALPANLAEAELFGYRQGAFTGADRASPGYFRAAHRGTLLLDEFVELPLPLQAKLLRAIEAKEVTPLGESRAVPVDVRLVVAAQAPLSRAVGEGRLRPDLFARLDGVTIALASLRERREDIPGLFFHFLNELSGGHPPRVEPRLVEQLCLYTWPFNVRELQQLTRKLLLLNDRESLLTWSHLPERIRAVSERPASPSGEAAIPAASRENRDGTDLRRLLAALEKTGGNLAEASAAAGISRQRAYRLIHRTPGVNLRTVRKEGGG